MVVELETLPPLSVKGPMPVLLLGLLPVCAISETSPVGVPLPEPGAILMMKLTGWPWVSVIGLVAGSVESDRLVVDGVKFEVHLLTKFATLTEPNPVARLYPVVVAYAAEAGLPETIMPYWPEVGSVLLQFGVPPWQITELFPTVTS